MASKQKPPSEVIRDTIRSSGLSAYQLENLSGVTHPIIYRFLDGSRKLSQYSLDRLCVALGLELVQTKNLEKSTSTT